MQVSVITKNGLAGKGWREFAKACARDASENHFPSRRGAWHIVDLDVLVLFNNNPYANFPSLRDEETAKFRQRLAAKGLVELAYATYPPAGQQDAGYTYALVIQAGKEHQQWVRDTMMELTTESMKIITEASKQPNR